MKLRTISEGWAREAGHVTLDLVGLIPGVGEPVDLTNAIWYAQEGKYLNCALSLISMVPEIGDAIGKGAKYLGKSSPFVAKFVAKHGAKIAKYWPKIAAKAKEAEKLRPYIKSIDNALQEFLATDADDESMADEANQDEVNQDEANQDEAVAI